MRHHLIFASWRGSSYTISSARVLLEGRAIRAMNGGMIWRVRLAIICHGSIVRGIDLIVKIDFTR